MSSRTQWMVLLLLSGLWAGLVLWQVADTPEPTRVSLKFVTGQTASGEAGRGTREAGMKIRLDLLQAEQSQAGRAFVAPKNIFAPLLVEAPRVKGPSTWEVSTPASPAPQIAAPLPPPAPTPEELAAQAAQSELAQYRYLGYLSRQGRNEAFLSKGKELHIVRAGETIEQRILVRAITPTGVSLQETRSQVEKTVLLAGEGK